MKLNKFRFYVVSVVIITTISFVLISNLYWTEFVFAQKSMQTYENEKYGFKIQYPFNWEYDGFDMLSTDHENLGSFKPILSSEIEDPYFFIQINFLPTGNSYTLDEYAELKLQEVKDHKIEDSFHFDRLISFDNNYTLGGKPAYKIVYQQWSKSPISKEESYPQYIQVGTITDMIEYRLKFVAHNAEQLNEYLPIAEKIINSFEFTQQ